jgi:5'-3' exonuclease
LVIDGDSFAHRSYHALPKTILRRGRKPAGAILGFANMLLRLYREEQPGAVLVAWDTLDVPTSRHEKFPAYQSGREFDDALLEQLDVLPEFVACNAAAKMRQPRSRARSGATSCNGRKLAAFQVDCDHESEGAATEASEPKAELA